MIRSSADWNPRKTKSKNKNRGTSRYSGGSVKILTEVGDGGNACGASPDVWCGPGVGFSTDAVVGGTINPVEANPPRRNIPARRKIDGDKNYSSTSHNSNQTEVVTFTLINSCYKYCSDVHMESPRYTCSPLQVKLCLQAIVSYIRRSLLME